MAYCTNCGTAATGRYCPNCGSALGGSDTGAGFSAAPGGTARPISAPGLADNVASTLCYLLVPAILFLFIEPYRRTRLVRFHAFQAIFAYVGLVILGFVLMIIDNVFIVAHAWYLGSLLWSVVNLAIFIGWLYLMYQTFNNHKISLPVVGDLAEKQA